MEQRFRFSNLIKGVRAAGNEVVIVYPLEKDISVIREFETLGCKCTALKRVPCSWFVFTGLRRKIAFPLDIARLVVNKLMLYHQLKKIVAVEGPDIIHTKTGVVHEGFSVARHFNIPHVWHLREYQLKDFNGHPFPSMQSFKQKLNKTNTVCITKDIQRYFELDANPNSFAIYNPVMSDGYLAEKDGALSSMPYFFVANRISKEKGIEEIISAFAVFQKTNPTYKLLISGFGNEQYISYLKNLCYEKTVKDSVEFLGYADSDRIYKLMYNSKALIVASYNEGFGRMTAEANMLGIPVIGRNTAGTKEILEQTKGGFQFSTEKEMSDKMKLIAKMTVSEREGFMLEPKRIAKELFSNEQHIKKMLSLYESILETNVGGGTTVK